MALVYKPPLFRIKIVYSYVIDVADCESETVISVLPPSEKGISSTKTS